MKEKILTNVIVCKLGFDKASVITADMLEGYTNIGDYAFYKCSGLTSVTIPNSVTSIGESAFYMCTGLISISVEDSNTTYDSRNNCNAIIETASNTLIIGCKNTIIPNSVTSIGESAFYRCSGLTSIDIPNGVTSIGGLAFTWCISLTSVTIPNSVTKIRDYAFSDCSSLSSIEIPDGVTSIGNGAFHNCIGLVSVTIPNSVTSIGESAFSGCNFKQEKRIDNLGRIIACKGFNADMTCRDFQYKEGETYELDGKPILCERGFHACLNPMDCFGYYCGRIGIDVVFHEVYLEGVLDSGSEDSKVVARKITIGREISLSEMADIANGRK